MNNDDCPKYEMGRLVTIAVDVEHEGGVRQVTARFRHEEWDGVVIECSGFARPRLFGLYPRRARVMLIGKHTWDRNAGPYQLEHLEVSGGGRAGKYEVRIV